MHRELKQTLLYAALLGCAAAAAPFLALLPLPRAAVQGSAATAAGAATAAPSATPYITPSGGGQGSAASEGEAAALLIYDTDSGSVLEVTPTEYMIGAAACEMPTDWPDAAIQAQMVAAYSYALYADGQGTGTDGACLDVNRAQCSGWTDAEVLQSRWGDEFEVNYARLQALAEGVQGCVLLYGGAPAAACYHAVSCGHTEASERVWGEALPYLCGVDSVWDKYSEDYEVTIQLTSQQVESALLSVLGLSCEGEPSGWFCSASWDAAGYVQQMTVCGQRFSGTQLRRALGLRSACFSVAWRDGGFVITTRGYGHGVGLSQYGAYSMAQGGAGWRDILLYYYPGTAIGTAGSAVHEK